MDFYNVAELRGTRNYVHVLLVRLFRPEYAKDDHLLEKAYDPIAAGMQL